MRGNESSQFQVATLKGRMRKSHAMSVTALLIATVLAPAVSAERPAGPSLLPDRTMAYLRVHDTREFAEKFKETGFGQLLDDNSIRPLIQQLYGSASEAFSQIEDQVGASLTQLLEIPQGEFCIALVDPGVYEEAGGPVVVIILEAGENEEQVTELMKRATDAMTRDGGKATTEAFGDMELNVVTPGDDDEDPMVYFIREGTLIASSNLSVAKDIVQTWEGISETRKLAENRKFSGMMRRSRGTDDERPHMAWYVDPLLILRVVGRENAGMAAAMAILPLTGLSGIKAIGGTSIMDTSEFDSIAHMHIMLDSPKRGLLKVLEFQTGDTTPEPWIPSDIVAYMTGYFDAVSAFEEIDTVVSRIRGEDAVKRMIEEQFTNGLGIDLQTEILDQWGGRVTLATWLEPPSRLNSQSTLLAFKLKDAAAFQKTIDRITEKFADEIKTASHRKVDYYRINEGGNRPNRTQPGQPQIRGLIREPTPAFGIVGDYVVVTDSEAFFKHAIDAQETGESLSDHDDFKMIASRIGRHLGTDKPSMISFQRPALSLKPIYEAATSDQAMEGLRQAGDNPVLKVLTDALSQNPLPPFEDLAKYINATGGVLLQDESGLHYMAFSLKNQ